MNNIKEQNNLDEKDTQYVIEGLMEIISGLLSGTRTIENTIDELKSDNFILGDDIRKKLLEKINFRNAGNYVNVLSGDKHIKDPMEINESIDILKSQFKRFT